MFHVPPLKCFSQAFSRHSFHQHKAVARRLLRLGWTPLLLSHGMDFFGLRSLSNLYQGLFQMLVLVLFIFVRIFIGTVHMISQLMGGGGDGAGDDSGRRGGRGPPPGRVPQSDIARREVCACVNNLCASCSVSLTNDLQAIECQKCKLAKFCSRECLASCREDHARVCWPCRPTGHHH